MGYGPTFLHAIDLANPTSSKYVAESGSLNSLMATTFLTNARSDHHMLALDEMCRNADQLLEGVLNPRSIVFYLASKIRRFPKQRLFVDGNPNEMTTDKKAKLLELSDRELIFEYVRRHIAPEKPTRYTCLYLAENDIDGRINLGNMLEFFYRPYIMEVTALPNPFAIARVDRRWFDAYASERNIRLVVNYWLGKPFNAIPAWEYLLEGSAVVDPQDKKYVSLYGSHANTRQS